MMNASVLQLLLAVLTGWLDRQEREILRFSLHRIASCSGSRGANAYN